MDQQIIENISKVLTDLIVEIKTSETQSQEEEDFNEEFIAVLQDAIANPTEDTIRKAMTMISIYSETHEQMSFVESLDALAHAEISDTAMQGLESLNADEEVVNQVSQPTTVAEASTTPVQPVASDQSQIDQLRQQLASLAK